MSQKDPVRMTWLNEVYYDTDYYLCHSTLHLAKSSEQSHKQSHNQSHKQG